MRFEFIESIIRIAISKYGKGVFTTNIAEAITKIFTDNIIPNIKLKGKVDVNQFRVERLYNEEVDIAFKKHIPLLKAIYSRFRLRPLAGNYFIYFVF